jgi:hypothetical protein
MWKILETSCPHGTRIHSGRGETYLTIIARGSVGFFSQNNARRCIHHICKGRSSYIQIKGHTCLGNPWFQRRRVLRARKNVKWGISHQITNTNPIAPTKVNTSNRKCQTDAALRYALRINDEVALPGVFRERTEYEPVQVRHPAEALASCHPLNRPSNLTCGEPAKRLLMDVA